MMAQSPRTGMARTFANSETESSEGGSSAESGIRKNTPSPPSIQAQIDKLHAQFQQVASTPEKLATVISEGLRRENNGVKASRGMTGE